VYASVASTHIFEGFQHSYTPRIGSHNLEIGILECQAKDALVDLVFGDLRRQGF
jgi:hypothetical protein